MGNSASSRQEPPRPPPPKHKVLLELDTTPRLRPTHNGAILQGGGTISQRNLQRSDLYGSEPDLRLGQREEAASRLRISRNNRKKYRAPPVPQYEHHQREFVHEWESKPSRRLRLFLTKAETKRKFVQEPASLEPVEPPPPSGRLRRSLSTPQFQQNQELSRHYDPPPSRQQPGNSFLEELREKQMLRESRFKKMESEEKEDSARQREEENLWLVNTKSPVPVKTFYFGMDEPVDDPFGFDSVSPKARAASYSSSESQLSDGFHDYDETSGGISVHLRATLPRKQVEIPRFSPAAAWRLLSAAETRAASPVPPLEEEVVESRILAPPPIQIPALLPDKSADSGISGDASPQQFDSAAWTPQQDLEETSSDGFPTDFLQDLRYTPRLALSLPKEQAAEEKPPFVFSKPFPDLDNNWMLSTSIPSSVNYQAEDDQPTSLVKRPSFSYLTTGGHIMYLPEYSGEQMTKSCEDLTQPQEQSKPKKFTFQSTIRQQERKVLADKLSRIAEYTELKRRSEQEVMRRVEEEFQRKREREKADIRQQLRLFNITNRAASNLSNPS